MDMRFRTIQICPSSLAAFKSYPVAVAGEWELERKQQPLVTWEACVLPKILTSVEVRSHCRSWDR